ncbi:Protein kinase rad3 [Ceratobasidium theobromae]|uniref:Protein kinase rad3 n=1 Tax=Ceratobasidium theobromae TaxID=1582974 RepID=A0A5N5Q7T6_9AGAM|nr:Protein kinase rad3 [Ceratobasidium theobromae]
MLSNFTNGDLRALESALVHLYLARYHQFGDPEDRQQAMHFGGKLSQGAGKNSPSWDSRNIDLALVRLETARQVPECYELVQNALEQLEPHASTHEVLIYICEALALAHRDSLTPRSVFLPKLRAQLENIRNPFVPPWENPIFTVPEATHLAALAFSYLTLYEEEKNNADLTSAIDRYVTATTSANINKQHPSRCSWLIGLGRAYNFKNWTYDAINCFQEAAKLMYAIPAERMDACLKWEKTNNADLIAVYKQMLDIVPRLVGLEQRLPHRIENVKVLYNLAERAFQAAIEKKNLPLALEFSERCRGNIFQGAFEVRTLLVHPEFLQLQKQAQHRARAQSLRQAVKNLNQTSSLLHLKGTEEEKQQQHRNAAKYVNEVRKVRHDIEGFGNFLQPISEKLIQAAKHSHIIIVNAHQGDWDALIIKQMSNTPHYMKFKIGGEVYRLLASRWIKAHLVRRYTQEGRGTVKEESDQNIGMKQVLTALWKDVVNPIIKYLGCTVS